MPQIMSSSTSSGASITMPRKPGALRPVPAVRPHSRLASDIALRREIRVEYFARHGRGRATAAAAVLDDDGERNVRVLGGRERDEQAMVAQALVDFRFLVLLVLRHREHLRGPGL